MTFCRGHHTNCSDCVLLLFPPVFPPALLLSLSFYFHSNNLITFFITTQPPVRFGSNKHAQGSILRLPLAVYFQYRFAELPCLQRQLIRLLMEHKALIMAWHPVHCQVYQAVRPAKQVPKLQTELFRFFDDRLGRRFVTDRICRPGYCLKKVKAVTKYYDWELGPMAGGCCEGLFELLQFGHYLDNCLPEAERLDEHAGLRGGCRPSSAYMPLFVWWSFFHPIVDDSEATFYRVRVGFPIRSLLKVRAKSSDVTQERVMS